MTVSHADAAASVAVLMGKGVVAVAISVVVSIDSIVGRIASEIGSGSVGAAAAAVTSAPASSLGTSDTVSLVSLRAAGADVDNIWPTAAISVGAPPPSPLK